MVLDLPSFLVSSFLARAMQGAASATHLAYLSNIAFHAPMLLPAATVADARSIGDGDGQELFFGTKKDWVMCDV